MMKKSGLFLVALFGTLALADADSCPRSCDNELVAQDCNACDCTNDCMPCDEQQKSCCDNRRAEEQVQQIKYNVSLVMGDKQENGEVIAQAHESLTIDFPQVQFVARADKTVDNNITMTLVTYRKMEDGSTVEHAKQSADGVWGQAIEFECPEVALRLILTATQA